MKLFTLTSDLHSELARTAAREQFIKDIEAAMGQEFHICDADFSSYGEAPGEEFIYVRTGGTEGIFKSLFCKDGKPAVPEPVRLLASGRSNSLAASMEILSYLNLHGVKGEILHGSAQDIAERILHPCVSRPSGEAPAGVLAVSPRQVLAGRRYAVIGHPSDWLISSDVDYARAKEALGAELIDIPMEELLSEISRHEHPAVDLPALNVPKYGRPIPASDLEQSLDIYGALRRLTEKYSLSGLTVRCFDLLTAVHNTGCMSLALLNSEGFTATCEGDVPAMLSMALAREVSGVSGFQVNLSRIEKGECLFAHCTVPLDMVKSWVYDTHFESGIGVAVHGEMEPGPATLFKLSPDCSRMFVREVGLVCNRYGDKLCRTQVVVKGEGLDDYFLRCPIGNHHIIIPGHRAGDLEILLS